MSTSGNVPRKKIDELGRILIPKVIREKVMIELQEEVLITYNTISEEIIIEKRTSVQCIICGSSDAVSKYKNASLCKDCKSRFDDREDKHHG